MTGAGRNRVRLFVLVLLFVMSAAPASAVTVYEKDDKKVQIGGRVQPLYEFMDPDCPSGTPCLLEDSGDPEDGSRDRFVFRRLRPFVQMSMNERWSAKIEVDFGEAEGDDEVQVKDAFINRTGFSNKNSRLSIGNDKTVFAREFLTSSASLQLVERGFTGDHNFGVPDRGLGVRWDSALLDRKITYSVSAGSESHDPAVNRMDFDTPVNSDSDWNEGWVAAGRIDFHPFGHQEFSQADFERGDSRVTIGLSAFVWRNDDDRNTYIDPNTGSTIDIEKVDLDEAHGVEVSAAYRGGGFSIDAAYQMVRGETVDPEFTGGIYEDGTTVLDKVALVGGYMVVKESLEVVLGWDSQDADNYEKRYERASVGLNWYLNQHDLKFQITYRRVNDFIGLEDQDNNTVFGSAQFKF